MDTLLNTLAIWMIPVLLAITLHEVAHGWAALALGDRTAQLLGRLSFNPLKHIDPVGTIAVPFSLLLMSSMLGSQPFLFGWAKPVPISLNNLTHPQQDMAWIALAGPASNFIQAILWASLLHLPLEGTLGGWVHQMALSGIIINLVLIALNMLPIPPLDGSRVLSAFLPTSLAGPYGRLEPYGFVILIALIVIDWLTPLTMPIYNFLQVVLFDLMALQY